MCMCVCTYVYRETEIDKLKLQLYCKRLQNFLLVRVALCIVLLNTARRESHHQSISGNKEDLLNTLFSRPREDAGLLERGRARIVP